MFLLVLPPRQATVYKIEHEILYFDIIAELVIGKMTFATIKVPNFYFTVPIWSLEAETHSFIMFCGNLAGFYQSFIKGSALIFSNG